MRIARNPLAPLAAMLLASTPLSALAGNCNASGGLFYLGNTNNAAKSVWLSATSAGSFRLTAAQGNTTVDQWSKDRRGLNVTLSPFVSNGSGGTHKLYDTTGNKDCLLDTQNQKAGLTLPPHISFPNIRPPGLVVPPIGKLFPGFSPLTPMLPGGVKPPIGTLPPGTGTVPITPTRPVVPTFPGAVTPPIGILPPVTGITPTVPGAVTPPIGTLPPVTGITPGMPGGVTPPIGTLPPVTGITPGMPGGVTPPIGTLPPVTGITPGMPGGVTPPIGTLPPVTGITPGMPGGVTPPIGTLPPVTGVTPGMPGGVTPPIGTLPPVTGVTPGMPGGVTPPIGTLPPVTGVTPGMPGGVTPPIGTLPPVTGVTPGMPGGVTPPIGTLPPVTGVTPGMPGGVTPPIGTLPPGGGGSVVVVPGPPGTVTPPSGFVPAPASAAPTQGEMLPRDDRPLDCPDPRNRRPGDTEGRPDCEPAAPLCLPNQCQATDFGVPVTPGRDLGVGTEADWNLWTDIRVLSSNDGRYGLDVAGSARTATVGLDRKVNDRIVVGLTATWEDSRSTGYGGFFQGSSRGVTVGPYAAFVLSPNWAIDAALGYNRSSNDMGLSVLGGTFQSQRLSAAVNLHGQYDVEGVTVRPRLSAGYARTFSDGYDLNATVFGQQIGVTFPSATYDYGAIEAAAEINRMFVTANGTRIMPYAEFGAVYEYARPNGGQILSSTLQLVTPSPWSFTVRTGARVLLSESVLLEASAGYLSFGQGGLDVVEGRIHLSVSF